jgi:flagellum-specific ATP synthase
MHDIADAAHQAAARKLRAILNICAETEDLVRIGAYTRGTNPQIDRAIELRPAVEFFLKQEIGKHANLAETRAALDRIAAAWPF